MAQVMANITNQLMSTTHYEAKWPHLPTDFIYLATSATAENLLLTFPDPVCKEPIATCLAKGGNYMIMSTYAVTITSLKSCEQQKVL